MATQFPFSLLDRAGEFATESLRKLAPPDWMVREIQRRLVLLLNHVVKQEREAQERLERQKGRVILAQWRQFSMRVVVTPAGLFDLADPASVPDLTITAEDASPWDLARDAWRGTRPTIRIDGDVQLAAEVNWMAEHLRWDVEEDLARIVGDVPAHTIAGVARQMTQAVRSFVDTVGGKTGGTGAGRS